MNSNDRTEDRYPDDDENVARLLQGAGRRAPLPDDVRQRMEQTFRSELAASRGERLRKQTLIVGSMAASVLVAVLVLFQPDPAEERQSIASVTRNQGDVTWQWDEDSGPLEAGNRIQLGDRIETGNGYVSFTPDGSDIDVRLGEFTVAEWRDQYMLMVHAGVVYVDSDPAAEHYPLVLAANGLTVEHVGTQYLLSREAGTLEVAVREGEITLAYNGMKVASSVAEGEAELLKIGGEQAIERVAITPFDERWRWTAVNTPVLDTHGMPVRAFFDWFSRQTGYRVDASVVPDELLKGQFDTSDIFKGLDEVLDANSLQARIDHDRGEVIVFRSAR